MYVKSIEMVVDKFTSVLISNLVSLLLFTISEIIGISDSEATGLFDYLYLLLRKKYNLDLPETPPPPPPRVIVTPPAEN